MEILDAYGTEKKKQAVTPQIAKESEGLIDYQERRQGLRNPLSVPASTAKQSQPEQQEPQAVSIQQPQTGVMATSKGYQKVLADAAQYQTQSQNQFSGITVSPQEYGIITSAMARSDDPVKTGSRYAQALLYSRNYGIPVSNAYDNLDSLNTALTGRKVEYTPTGLQSVANSFKVGQLSMDRSDVASRWEAAYRSGNEALANQYDMQLQQIDAEMKALQDNAPRGLGTTLLKLAAESTPYTARILLKGATIGAGVALTATGVGALAGVPLAAAGTLGGIGSAFSTASIYTAASAAGSWKAGYDLNRSSQYYDFIKAGIDPTAADWASSVGSSVSSGIETFLGEVPLISRAISGRGVSKLTSKVMSRLALNGTWGALATGGVEYLMSSVEEGLEEVLQEFTDSAAEAAAYELSDKIAPKKSIPVLKRAMQAGLAGFGAALVMGGLPAAVNAKVSVQDAKYLNQEAAETPSREAFVKNHMEDASLSGLEEKERKDALSGVWEKQQAKASAQETPETKAELSAVDIDEIDQPENIGEKDENGNEIQAIPSRYPDRQIERMVDGRLRTQEARKNWPVVNSDGSETHMLLLGSMGDNRRYGNIRYTMDGSSTIRIDQVQTRPGYDEIVADGIKELGRRYEGYDIQWDPEISSQQAVMTKLISDNPRGSDKGLNWYDPLTDTDEAIALGKLIKRRFGNLNRDESTVAAQLLQLVAKSQGKKVNQWLVDNVSSFENADMGAGRKGGIEFKETEQGIRATIYAAENADFSTFAHETFHLIRHTAGNSKELATALQEASRTADFAKYIEEHNSIIHMSPDEAVASVQSFSDDGKWTVAQEELAATMFESYLKDNSTASPKLKNLFQKIADWFGRIYQKIRSTVKMDDRVVKAFDEMLAGNPELAKTIQNQNRESTETILNQMDDSPESQYAAIEAKYKNTDQWLKAPNGNPTNLTERQWVQVRTPNFIKWFGDWINDPFHSSEVVDDNGEPLPVFHRTSADFDTFDRSQLGHYTFGNANDLESEATSAVGFWFNSKKDVLKYHDRTIEAFLNIRSSWHPGTLTEGLEVELASLAEDEEIETPKALGERYALRLENRNYDGLILTDDELGGTSFVALDPNQIKSATDNVGTFDGENPNILFQESNEKRPLEKRVSKDYLLDVKDMIDEVREVGANVNELGIITVYHATSKEAANNIESTGRMIAKEDGIFFSTKSDGQISGYGESVVKLEIPAELLIIDDLFDDEAHLVLKLGRNRSRNVSNFGPTVLFQEAPSDYQPKSTGIGYKVFVQKDGKLYPPMVANPNGEGTPVGKWLLADEAPIAAYSKTGRPQVKSGGKGTQGRSGLLAYRPGWHLGEIPYAKQFNRLNPATGNKELFPKDFVWAEVEYSKDNDYNEEARQNGASKNGGFNHAFASLHRMPTDGFYNYRTNPDPTTDPWVITGAMKVNKILTREEVETIVKDAGREPQKVEGDSILFQTAIDRDLDKAYFDALEKGDISEAQKIVQAVANARGYNSSSEYRIMHKAPNSTDGISLNAMQLVEPNDLLPKDYFSHWEWYRSGYGQEELESFNKINHLIEECRRYKNGERKTEPRLWMYRAVGRGIKEDSFRNGDWITPSKSDARLEGLNNGVTGYRIIAQNVRASQIWWNADSIAEWGFDDGKNYAYRNTRNNRKILDTITKDEDGNIIPPSKRFNYRNDSILYQTDDSNKSNATVATAIKTIFGYDPYPQGRRNGWDYAKNRSVNASIAYDDGAKPDHLWTKAELSKQYARLDLDPVTRKALESLPRNEQQELALKYEGWHHTGRNFRKTEFYSFDEEAVRSITIDDVSYAKERIKLYKLYSTRYNLLKMIPPQFITASYTQEGSRVEKHGYLKANHFYPDDLRTVLDEAAKTIESNTDPEALEFIKTHGSNAMNVSQSQNVYADGRKPSPWDYQNGDFFKNGDIRAKTIFNDNGGVIGFVLEIYSDGEFIPYKDLAGNVEQSDIKSLFKFLEVPNPWAGDFIDAASIEDFQIIQDTDSIGGLYQTEDEYQQMVKEAEFFFSFKEFASYWKTMYDEDTERSLLEKAYEESQRVDEVELERLLYPPAKGFNKQMSDEQKDEELSRQIDTEEGLDKFMSAIRNLSNFNWRYLGGEIQGMGKEDEIEHNTYVRFETEASPFLVAMAKSTKDLTDISKKQIRTTIKNNIRMYRDLYAEILHDPTLEAANYDTFLPDIDEPISEVSKLSIMDRKRLSSRIEAEGLRRKILRGTETRKGDAEKVIVELDTQIANLKKDVQRNEMQQETLKGKLSASESAFFDKVLELRGARKALDALNRSVRKKIDNGSRVEAKEIAHRTRIQDKIDLLDKQINDWHEQNKDEKKALRIAATQKKNDAIEELKKQIREKETQRREARKVVEYKERLATAIVTKPSTAVDFEYAQKINAIRQLVDPNFRADHVNFNGKKYTLAEFRDFVNSSDNPLELTPYQLDRVTKKSLDEWTVAELEDMAQTVANLRQEGRQIWQAKVDKRQHEADIIQNSIISTLLANPKYRGADDQPASSSAEARQEKRSMSTRIRSTMLKTLNMDRKAQMLDGGVKGAAFDVLVREKRDAQSEEYRSITAREQAVIDVMKSTGVTAKDLYELVPITVDGKIQKYSYSDMIYVINAAKETRNYQAVSYGTLVNAQEKSNLNHDDEAIKSLGDARYRQFVSQAEAYLADKPELMTVFNAIEDNLQGQAQRINDVLIREYNEPMQVENYYLPIYRQDFNGTEIAQQIQDDVFNRNAGKSTTAPKSGFKQTRIDISPDHQMPVSFDYFGTWMKSVQQQEHLIANIEYVRKLNRVFKNLGSRDLRSSISATYGDSMLSDIDQYMNEVANPQVFTDVQGLNDGIKFLRGNVYSAYLGYKTSSIVLQAISSPMPYLAEVNPIQLAAGLLKMTAHPAKTWQFITSQSSFMANRSMHPVIDQIKKQAETYTDPKVKRAYSNFLEFGMKGLEAIDRWAVAGGWLAVYDKKLSQMEYQTSPESMKAAAKYADEVVYETQPVGDITELSPLFKSKSEFANAFLQFQTALNVIWQNTVYDVPKAFKQKKFRKAIGLIAGYSLAGILLTAVMDGFDDDDDETDKLRKLIYGSFTQYTDAVPIIGSSIEDMVYSSITGEKPYQYPSSFLPAWDKIKIGVLQLTQGNLVKAAEKLGEGAALSLGLPVSGIKEIMALFEDGEFHPEALAGQRE